eukprot:gene12040-2626_t
MEQVEEHQSVNNEEAENSVIVNQQEGGSTDDRAYIDVEAITVREDVIKDVVDLTKDNATSFVDLTKEDTPRQPLRRARARSRRQQKSSHPYGQRQSTSHDTSIEIIPESSSPSQSVESSPEQNSGKKICCPVCMDDSDRERSYALVVGLVDVCSGSRDRVPW